MEDVRQSLLVLLPLVSPRCDLQRLLDGRHSIPSGNPNLRRVLETVVEVPPPVFAERVESQRLLILRGSLAAAGAEPPGGTGASSSGSRPSARLAASPADAVTRIGVGRDEPFLLDHAPSGLEEERLGTPAVGQVRK